VRNSLTDAVGGRERNEDVEATIVEGDRREVETPGAVFGPRIPFLRGVNGKITS
jgi:hypothetical protein